MSAAPSEHEQALARRERARRRPDMAPVMERRRRERRRRRLARLDVGLGVLFALVLLLATPGLAITAIIALPLIAACIASLVVERRRARRGDTAATAPSRSDARAGEEPRDLRGHDVSRIASRARAREHSS